MRISVTVSSGLLGKSAGMLPSDPYSDEPVMPNDVSLPSSADGPSEEREQASRPPSFRACVACRQMKMKCDAGEGEQCTRCRKAGRECVPQTTRRKPGPVSRTTSPNFVRKHESIREPKNTNGFMYNLPAAPKIGDVSSRIRNNSSTGNGHLGASFPASTINADNPLPQPKYHRIHSMVHGENDLADLPSIYSTPPIDAVVDPSTKEDDSLRRDESPSKKRKISSISQSRGEALPTPATSQSFAEDLLLPRKDLHEMIQLFIQRHLVYIPVLRQEDFSDIDAVIDNELPLVYCICYVTARYLPGGKTIRELLLPEVTKVPASVFPISSAPYMDETTTLNSLAVLICYADMTPVSKSCASRRNESLLYWYLKSVLEVYATRVSLHRSVQDLRQDLRSGMKNIMEAKSFRRYLYWLWLFDTAEYCAIVTGTPPSIRMDSSLRAAPNLLEQIGFRPGAAGNLFIAVELSIIWEKASSRHPQLGEWWCLPDPAERVDEDLIESILIDTDKEIDRWHNKWYDYITNDPFGGYAEYKARFIRFCITSYAIKCLQRSSRAPIETPENQIKIRRCLECANHVLNWPLSCGPVQKDKLRYVDDSASILISYCCLFILSICQTFTSSVSNIPECLNYVTSAAQLLIDLAMNQEHEAHIQGTFLLKRAEAFKAALTNSQEQEATKTTEELLDSGLSSADGAPRSVFDGLDQIFEDGFYGMDPIWDFSMLFPNN